MIIASNPLVDNVRVVLFGFPVAFVTAGSRDRFSQAWKPDPDTPKCTARPDGALLHEDELYVASIAKKAMAILEYQTLDLLLLRERCGRLQWIREAILSFPARRKYCDRPSPSLSQ